MTRSIMSSRRALALLVGTATATTLLVSGCGAGQIAETAVKEPSIYGVNLQTADNSVKIRNLAVSYLNTEGYPAGGDAPLQMALYNDSAQPVTVRVDTESARSVVLVGGPATALSPTTTGAPPRSGVTPTAAGESPAPTTPATTGIVPPTATPTAAPAPAEVPANIEIPPFGYVMLTQATGTFLQLTGLNEALAPGESVSLIFEVNGVRLEALAPVAIPLSPAPRATPESGGHVGGAEEGGHGA